MTIPALSTSPFEASVLGQRYHRVLADCVDREFTAPLKLNYDYSFVVSYGAFDDPEYEVVEKKDVLIDLTQGLESLHAGFHSSCRTDVNKTRRFPKLQFCSHHDDFESLYQFHRECEQDRDWFPIPEEELRNSVVISATFHGQLFSAMSFYWSDRRLRIGRIFSKRRSQPAGNMPHNLFGAAAKRIVFEICKYGLEHGYETLDLGGIDTDDPAKAGIARFKKSFGGTIVPVKIGRFAKPEFQAQQRLIREMGLDVT